MAKREPQLHELLAVEGDAMRQMELIVKEAETTFGKKTNLFEGHNRAVTMFDEGRVGENVSEDVPVSETVMSKLAYAMNPIKRVWGITLQKDASNQNATADLIVNGVTLGENLPATWLLMMEKRLASLRDLMKGIPTLPAGVVWVEDSAQGEGIFRTSAPTVAMKTEKTINHKILVNATDKHPAQIEKWTEDVPVGRIEKTQYSGMISPAKKAAMIDRLETLIRAVKQARERANCVTIDTSRDGVVNKIGDFLLNG